jgi:hypothetical protein
MNDWRVNRCRFDQGYPNWGLFLQQLHSERLGEAFDRVFAGALHPLKRQGHIGSYTADIDECSTLRRNVLQFRSWAQSVGETQPYRSHSPEASLYDRVAEMVVPRFTDDPRTKQA